LAKKGTGLVISGFWEIIIPEYDYPIPGNMTVAFQKREINLSNSC